MTIEIRVNGVPYNLWKTATVTRSIDLNTGAFRFTSSAQLESNSFPVKSGDQVQILVNSKVKITGFVDAVSILMNDRNHIIEVYGRDNIQDVVDSSVPIDATLLEGTITLKQLAEQVISALGANIPVIDESGIDLTLSVDELEHAGAGKNAMQFLVSFARKRQVYLIPSGTGKLIIYRPGSDRASSSIEHTGGPADNVLKFRAAFDQSQRYGLYIARSADNFGATNLADYKSDGINRNGSAVDSGIRSSRYLEIIAEESMDENQVNGRANEEANIRRAQSAVYEIETVGFSQRNGDLWDIGLLVKVNDIYANMKGLFLIKEVEYIFDNSGGSTTRLVLVSPDAYKVQGDELKTTKRVSTQAPEFQRNDAQQGSSFKR